MSIVKHMYCHKYQNIVIWEFATFITVKQLGSVYTSTATTAGIHTVITVLTYFAVFY